METMENAYAKLNLSLDVVSKMSDGYHELAMVMVSAGLSDRIWIKAEKGKGIRINTNVEFLPRDGRNIAHQAASLFLKKTGISDRALDITLIKKIPVCAGMGGGSSDAAAVLRALNRMFKTGLGKEKLQAMGARLGSDVPYCISGGTALARGRGEKLTPLPPMPPCHVVICKPDFSVSTPVLFSKIDCKRIKFRPQTQELVEAVKEGALSGIARRMYNVFEDLIPKTSPIHEIKSRLLDHDALGAVMSGTGPTVFGLFECAQCAENAYLSLRSQYAECYLTGIVNDFSVE